MKQIDEIMKAMQDTLPHKRYIHTLGVAYLAASYAMTYRENYKDAMLAGLLHDCAKCLSDEEILARCETLSIPVSETEHRQPFLLHGKLGAYYARKTYGIENERIINAICFHTTGRPEMTFLEKAIFLADYLEIGRTQPTTPDLNEIRRIAFTDMNKAVFYVANNTVNYLKSLEKQGTIIDSRTIETMEFYEKYK